MFRATQDALDVSIRSYHFYIVEDDGSPWPIDCADGSHYDILGLKFISQENVAFEGILHYTLKHSVKSTT